MKDKEEKKVDNKLEKKLEDLDLEKVLEKKRKRKRLILAILIILAILAVVGVMTYRYYRGNEKHIRADVIISSSSKLYSNSEPVNLEDVGEGALFILYIKGIKRDDFLAEYEVLEISINQEKVDTNNVTYRHLNNALSIRMHSENYNLEDGNVVIISLKEKNSGNTITKRLYHTTEVI